MSTTLLLDRTAWDLVLDSNGNIALASEPYSTAQDVASACMTFLGECWYDTTVGVPFWQILGQMPPLAFIRQQFENAAMSVPLVATAVCTLNALQHRNLTGQINCTDVSGNSFVAYFGTPASVPSNQPTEVLSANSAMQWLYANQSGQVLGMGGTSTLAPSQPYTDNQPANVLAASSTETIAANAAGQNIRTS